MPHTQVINRSMKEVWSRAAVVAHGAAPSSCPAMPASGWRVTDQMEVIGSQIASENRPSRNLSESDTLSAKHSLVTFGPKPAWERSHRVVRPDSLIDIFWHHLLERDFLGVWHTLLRNGRFPSKWGCQCGRRMLADFSLLIRFDHFRVAD